MIDREKTILWTMKYCQHYDPRADVCKAGVNYKEQFNGPRNTCLSGGKKTEEEQLAACPKWLRKTREMGEARADAREEAYNRLVIVGPVIAEWRAKPPIGKSETIKCPVCQGKLNLSQAAINGHVHARCETPNCVALME